MPIPGLLSHESIMMPLIKASRKDKGPLLHQKGKGPAMQPGLCYWNPYSAGLL